MIFVKIDEFLKTVIPAYCENWNEVYDFMKSEPLEWSRVQELMEEIKIRGLEEPGVIDTDYTDGVMTLINGTHRFIAHWELGLEDFPVSDQTVNDYENEDYFCSTVIKIGVHKGQNIDQLFDDLMSVSSFRLNDSIWVESEMMSGNDLPRSYEVSIFMSPLDEKFYPDLANAFIPRITKVIPLEVVDDFSITKEYVFDLEKFKN